jgi:7,8-dihydroneopterin aldolase/epimerase/oxygenase
MTDKIFLEGLEVRCIIGTLPRERKVRQKLSIDLEFPTSVRKAARRDSLKDAINYKKIADRITGFVSTSRFYLIETLAERLAAILLREFRLKGLVLRIRKPAAIRNAKSVGVEIVRK